MTIELANRLIEFRKKAGYSQDELANKIGVSRQAISKWERGESSPDTDNLIALAKLYNVSLDELVGIEKDKESNADDEDKKGDQVHIGLGHIDVSSEDGDQVHIGPGHIDVSSNDGDQVHVGFDGIEVVDESGKVHIKRKEFIFFNIIGSLFLASFGLIVVLVYVITGCLYKGPFGQTGVNAWAGLWPLFIFIPVPDSLYHAIKNKKFCDFAFVLVVTGVYCFVGMLTNLWHPYWFLFFFIPLYYCIFSYVDKKKWRRDNI